MMGFWHDTWRLTQHFTSFHRVSQTSAAVQSDPWWAMPGWFCCHRIMDDHGMLCPCRESVEMTCDILSHPDEPNSFRSGSASPCLSWFEANLNDCQGVFMFFWWNGNQKPRCFFCTWLVDAAKRLWYVATKPPNSGVAIENHRKTREILTLLKLLLLHWAYQVASGRIFCWGDQLLHGEGGTEMATLGARHGWLPGDCHLIGKPKKSKTWRLSKRLHVYHFVPSILTNPSDVWTKRDWACLCQMCIYIIY